MGSNQVAQLLEVMKMDPECEQPFFGEPDVEVAADDVDDGPNDMTCAICLEQTAPQELALIKGCQHEYCVKCILQWAMFKEKPWCPQCKAPFSHLICYRQLDGTLTDYPAEESVVLLKRARWFEEYAREQEKGKAVMVSLRPPLPDAPLPPTSGSVPRGTRDWVGEFFEDCEDADEDDDELEAYYFSSAAGRARVVLGNRRWGENGYVNSGRLYARPVPLTPNAQGRGGSSAAKGGSGCKTALGSSPAAAGSPMMGRSPPGCAAVAAGCSPGASGSGLRHAEAAGFGGPGPSGSAGKQGRRARRNAKRFAFDLDDDY